MRLGPEMAEVGSAELNVEGVVDGRVGGDEQLGGALALEPLLLPLSSAYRQVRVLRPVVLS